MMFSKLSIAVSVAASLQCVVAQQATTSKASAGRDNRQINLKGWEGDQHRCEPTGTGHDWDLYFPCRHAREVEDVCLKLAAVKEGDSDEQKQKAWKDQQACLCTQHKSYFDAVSMGCPSCKVTHGILAEKNAKMFTEVFEKLSGAAYCDQQTLKNDYGSYYKQVLDSYQPIQWGPAPERKNETIPVEEYWKPKDPASAPRGPLEEDDKTPAKEGTANVLPRFGEAPVAVRMTPSMNSSKVLPGTEKTEIAIAVVLLQEKRHFDGKGSYQSTIEADKAELVRPGRSIDVSKIDVNTLPDFTACSCAKAITTDGNVPAANEESRKAFQVNAMLKPMADASRAVPDFKVAGNGFSFSATITMGLSQGEQGEQGQSTTPRIGQSTTPRIGQSSPQQEDEEVCE
ncbi:hypothetical protein CDD83_7471 [Cordyceps sp. RAO-2017]|nr:hypothetical protein CDD83_7471 [Cordyceps sp. RAO-2017]